MPDEPVVPELSADARRALQAVGALTVMSRLPLDEAASRFADLALRHHVTGDLVARAVLHLAHPAGHPPPILAQALADELWQLCRTHVARRRRLRQDTRAWSTVLHPTT